MAEISEQVAGLSNFPNQPTPTIARKKITYEEFLEWADEDTLAEWEDGEIIMTSPASYRHQNINDFLTSAMRLYVEFNQSGLVLSAPFQMKLPTSGREPDLIFLAKENLGRLKDTFLDGPADLAIEILSPESRERDRGKKFYEYAEAGVPEYWLIDPMQEQAEFYQLDERGRYQAVQPDASGKYYSSSVQGFWLEVAWLWEKPLLQVEKVLIKIGGSSYANYLKNQLDEEGLL